MRIIVLASFVFSTLFITQSCNYQACRGKDYIIEGISHDEFISKLDSLRINFPSYKASEDRIDGHVPWYYFDISVQKLNMVLHCEMHMGDAIPNPPTHVKLLSVYVENKGIYYGINSDDIDEELNNTLIKTFETDILNVLNVEWKHDPCW